MISVVVLTSGTKAHAQSPEVNLVKPFVLGEITQLHSNILEEDRILNIYLPEGYSNNDTVKYPVIYLLDGSADEDFIHIAGLVQFNSFEWVHRIPRSIVVGIATVDRRRDFTFPTSVEAEQKAFPTSGQADHFIAFLEKELQPFIDKHYKTTSTKTIIGQSLGGLLATQIVFTKPTLFDHYIIVSPSLWWDNGSLLHKQISQLSDIHVYVGVGKEGLTPGERPRTMEADANLLAALLQKHAPDTSTIFFDYLPAENHATVLHAAVANAINAFWCSR